MRKLLTALGIAIAITLILPTITHGQVLRGVVIEPARSKMAAGWSTAPTTPERAWCVSRWGLGMWDGERGLYVVDVIESSPDSTSTPYATRAHCGKMPVVHTHPPATCKWVGERVDLSSCFEGGIDAYLCGPSTGDDMVLLLSQTPFGVVQCDRNAFVFYYPPLIPMRQQDSSSTRR